MAAVLLNELVFKGIRGRITLAATVWPRHDPSAYAASGMPFSAQGVLMFKRLTAILAGWRAQSPIRAQLTTDSRIVRQHHDDTSANRSPRYHIPAARSAVKI
jgi:hypothetical protein